MENSVKHQIHQILRITRKNGKIEYRGRTYAKNDVVLEPGWISDDFEWRETQLYKLVTTVTRDDGNPNIYTISFGRCNLQTLFDESKYEEIHSECIIFSRQIYIKKVTEQDIRKNKICLYIFPGAPTLFYQQGNQNSYILSSLVSVFHYMGD